MNSGSTNGSSEDNAKLGYPSGAKLDVEKYRKHVDHFDITEAQKIQLITTIWDIMRRFAEIGWGVDSINKFIPALNEFSIEGDESDVKHTDTIINFNSAATGDISSEGAGLEQKGTG